MWEHCTVHQIQWHSKSRDGFFLRFLFAVESVGGGNRGKWVMEHEPLHSQLSLGLPLCRSDLVLYYTSLNGTKLINAPGRRPPSAKCRIVFFHDSPLGPRGGAGKHLDDITDIGFQRSHCSPCEGQGDGGGWGEGDRADKDLFCLGVMTCTAGSTSWGADWCEAFFNRGKVLRHWGLVRRGLLSYCDGEGWGYTFAWWPEAFVRGPLALVFLQRVPGLYHRRVTPALSHRTLTHQLRTDPKLSAHTQHCH